MIIKKNQENRETTCTVKFEKEINYMKNDIQTFLRARTILDEGVSFDSIDESLKSFDLGGSVVLKVFNHNPKRVNHNLTLRSWNEINSIYAIYVDEKNVGFVEIWEFLNDECLDYVFIQQLEILERFRGCGYGTRFMRQLHRFVTIYANVRRGSELFYENLPVCWFKKDRDFFYYPKLSKPNNELVELERFLHDFVRKLSTLNLTYYLTNATFWEKDWSIEVDELTMKMLERCSEPDRDKKVDIKIYENLEDYIGYPVLKMLLLVLVYKKNLSIRKMAVYLNWTFECWGELYRKFEMDKRDETMFDLEFMINNYLIQLFDKELELVKF